MSVSLSAGMRRATYAMGDIQSQIDTSNKRLATGKKVNDALDNAGSYFRAQGFQKDARDYGKLLDSMEITNKAVDSLVKSLDGARKMVEAAQALGRQALDLGSTDAGRNTLGKQAAALLTQASRLLADTKFNGIDLIQQGAVATGLGTTVVTNLSSNSGTPVAQTSIGITAIDSRYNVATGFAEVAAASTATAAEKQLLGANNGLVVNGTAGAADSQTVDYTAVATEMWNDATNGTAKVQAFVAFAQNYINGIQANASALATTATTIQIRQEFTKSIIRTNNESADYLTLADINEEGANLSSLQTKQQLAVQALSLASRADQAILRLF